MGYVAYFGKFYKLGDFFCFIWRILARLSYYVTICFYGALTCSPMLGIIDSIYFEKSIYMIFGNGDCFTSLIWRYLAQLREIII